MSNTNSMNSYSMEIKADMFMSGFRDAVNFIKKPERYDAEYAVSVTIRHNVNKNELIMEATDNHSFYRKSYSLPEHHPVVNLPEAPADNENQHPYFYIPFAEAKKLIKAMPKRFKGEWLEFAIIETERESEREASISCRKERARQFNVDVKLNGNICCQYMFKHTTMPDFDRLAFSRFDTTEITLPYFHRKTAELIASSMPATLGFKIKIGKKNDVFLFEPCTPQELGTDVKIISMAHSAID